MRTSTDSASLALLYNLGRVHARLAEAQRQISSGIRVERASHEPGAVVDLLQLQTDLKSTVQVRKNLEREALLVDAAESALRQGAQLIDRALALAAAGANTTTSAGTRAQLAADVGAIHDVMVGLANTEAGGRYVFGGDADRSPAYSADAGGLAGVLRLHQARATRLVQGAGKTAFVSGSTAAEIFDARNPDDSLAADNVFSALWSLRTALAANDEPAIQSAIGSLQAGADRLNDHLSRYGVLQNRIAEEVNATSRAEVRDTAEMSRLRDADLASAAIELSQARLHEEAALSAHAGYRRQSLFDFLR